MIDTKRRPVLIYDAGCGFCRWCVGHWRRRSGDAIEFLPSAGAGLRFPEIPAEDMARSVQWIEDGGARYQESRAVFRMMAHTGGVGRWLCLAAQRVPGFFRAADAAYRWVAARRMWLSRTGCGCGVRRCLFP